MNAKRWFLRFLLTAAVILFSACSSPPVTVQRNAPAGQAPKAQSSPFLDFWADSTTIQKGGCTTLHWRSNWGGVWIEEKKYPETSSMQVCPADSRNYSAEVGDQVITRNVYIQVQAGAAQTAQPPAAPPANNSSPQLDFWADNTIINKGKCTTLRWRTNWGGVWIGEQKYPANGEMKVCPTADIQYNAEIGDQVLTRAVIIQVRSNAGQPPAPQQPAPPQPNPQQPNPPQPPSQPKTLSIVGGDSCAWAGDLFTIKLSTPIKVDVWVSNKKTSIKNVSSDGLSITFFVPMGLENKDNNIVEVRGEGLTAKRSFNLIERSMETFFTDLAVTDLFADNMPRGRIYARLTNRGPLSIINQKVTLDCKAELKPKSGASSGWDAFTIKQTYPMVTLAHNETKAFYTGIDNQSDLYSYLMTCVVIPPPNNYYSSNYCKKEIFARESNPVNNTYKEDIPFFFQ